jgi:hypothetical protein
MFLKPFRALPQGGKAKGKKKQHKKKEIALRKFFSFLIILNVRTEKVKKFLDETRAIFIDDGTKHTHKINGMALVVSLLKLYT